MTSNTQGFIDMGPWEHFYSAPGPTGKGECAEGEPPQGTHMGGIRAFYSDLMGRVFRNRTRYVQAFR